MPDGHSAYSEYRIGGTSLASPLYAGTFALAVQRAGHDFGLANPVLYAAPANDITKAGLDSNPGAVRVDYMPMASMRPAVTPTPRGGSMTTAA